MLKTKLKRYHFVTTCISSTAELINAMKEGARQVSYETMLKHCHDMLSVAYALGYCKSKAQGLTLRNDWHVSYWKSLFDGFPCYYFQWSGIEHIWINEWVERRR